MNDTTLDLSGLECEEALMLVRATLRKHKGTEPLRLCSSSATFHTLLTRWADASGHALFPILKPVQGERWTLDVQVVAHA